MPSTSKESINPDPPSSSLTPSSPTQPSQPSPAQSVEEIRIASLQAKIENLKRQIQETEAMRAKVDGNLKNKDAQATVKAHIKLLHDYNEIRDVGQGLMGIIADTRGVRVRDVYEDFGVAEGD
ncbi:DNA repair protein Swi5/Sae3, partial [Lecanoromycetidae sp. Uapishka_2]